MHAAQAFEKLMQYYLKITGFNNGLGCKNPNQLVTISPPLVGCYIKWGGGVHWDHWIGSAFKGTHLKIIISILDFVFGLNC